MNIQQAIIVIMLTSVICIFVAMVSMSIYPDKESAEKGFNKLARTVLFGFVLVPWIMIVCLTDLYMEQASLRHDMTENMSCA
jgi:hypothetical protein